jgi:hypothetical protein
MLIGCGGEPIQMGTIWTFKKTSSSVTKSFTLKNGGAPVDSLGPLGTSGQPCEMTGLVLAETSAGSVTTTTLGEHYVNSSVLGITEVYHPLVPNENEYSSSSASIIQERTRGAEYGQTTTVTFDPNSTTSETTVTNYSSHVEYYDDDGDPETPEIPVAPIETDASYYGVSADEYVVRFEVGNMWMDPESEITTGDVELLTRNDPQAGDIWSSVNGNTIYVSQGNEQVSFAGGVVKKSDKIEMFEVGTLQTDGADVIDQCVNVGANQLQTDEFDAASTALARSYLDEACSGTFQHVKTGTQWWVKNVLVKESSTTTRIEIKEYGYEWYETDESGEACVRLTSMTLDNPVAVLYVHYDLITEVLEGGVTTWAE